MVRITACVAFLTLFIVAVGSPVARGAVDAPAPITPPRAARSVHLGYPAPEADAFYNEVVVERSVAGSYFMVCGFNHGYFGIQEQGLGRKVVIFSVWDAAKGNDAKNVPLEQRVEVLHQDPGVEVKRFGGEGTGGQSFFPFEWKTGETYRFLVRAHVEGEKTAYSGWFYLPAEKAWKHLVTFRTTTGGDRLKGLYSFVEDFRRDTTSATQVRRAQFGNGWAFAKDWQPLAKARFTASSARWEAKETIDAGVADAGRFYLQTGGDTHTTTPLGHTIEGSAPGTKPADLPAEWRWGLAMTIHVDRVEGAEIAEMRGRYVREMNCQVIHDSIHGRPGWTIEHLLRLGGRDAGYGSMAVAGPWKDKPTLYEFYVEPDCRGRVFDLFEALRAAAGPVAIETQSNDVLLTAMLHTFARDVIAEAVLFHDRITTALAPPAGATFRTATAADGLDVRPEQLASHGVVEVDGGVAASGGILYHYNRPYGDIYMEVAEPYRHRGIGAYLVQELKRVCRELGSVPAARCNVGNAASRKTLQKAGFVPCGNLLVGSLRAPVPGV